MKTSPLNSTPSEPIDGPTNSQLNDHHAPLAKDDLEARRYAWIRSIGDWCTAHRRIFSAVVLVALTIPIWNSIGDHGFNGRSEARYASVAQDMSLSGDWLVPRYMGHVHLTKPPLVYWLEAGSIRLFGQSYLALRLPSALAGVASILLLFWFARRVTSQRVALVAAGLYAIMPLTIFTARMPVTDSVVNLMWMTMLWAGYLHIKEPGHRRWWGLFWGAAALGMLAKGPVLFIPVGVVGVWWVLLRSTRGWMSWVGIRRVGWFGVFLVLAMVPALVWAVAVYYHSPQAVDIWVHETFDRVRGQGDHSKPIWFFIPVLLAGCFPASAMLILPGVNLRWKDAIENLRGGNLVGYLGWASIVPFVVFSLISGKLTSYILPICGPMALLSAMMLERWFEQTNPDPGAGRRMPEVRRGLFVGTALFVLGLGGAGVYGFGGSALVWMYGLVLALVVAGWLWIRWKDRQIRSFAIAAFIGAWIIGWVGIESLEDTALAQMSYLPSAQEAFGQDGWHGRIGVYGLVDGMIYWDTRGELEVFETSEELGDGLRAEPMLLLSDAQQWDELEATSPGVFSAGQIAREWHQWPGAPTRYLIVLRDTIAPSE